jgi:PAT family beta-lactamase induction signal transducer AmpG
MIEKLRKTQFNFIFFGISAAMPSFALGIPFGLWLLSAGVTKQTLGLVTVSSIIVALNFLWSPFVNKIKLPILYQLFGLRRSWIFISQILLGFLLLILSILDPQSDLIYVVLVACLIYFFSSVQDIALDAYRVEYDKFFQAENLATVYQIGYKVGAFLIGAQVYGIIGADNWQAVYVYLAILMFCLPLVTVLSLRVDEVDLKESTSKHFLSAFRDLLQKNDIYILLLLVGLYKISDIVLGPMAAALYNDVGLNDPAYLEQKSYYNFLATFIGSGIALWSIKSLKIHLTMFAGALLVVTTNMLFSYLFIFPTFFNFIFINFLDTIAQAFTAVCFITFLVDQVNRRYTAIQYAFLASLVIIPGTLLKGTSGFITESVGFYNFFLVMGLMGIPSVCLSYLLTKKFSFNFQNNLRILAIASAMLIFILSLIQVEPSEIPLVNDKVLHFLAYFCLASLILKASENTKVSYLLLIMLSMGILIEIIQGNLGLRYFEYMDIIANSLGILAGFLIYIMRNKTLKKIS